MKAFRTLLVIIGLVASCRPQTSLDIRHGTYEPYRFTRDRFVMAVDSVGVSKPGVPAINTECKTSILGKYSVFGTEGAISAGKDNEHIVEFSNDIAAEAYTRAHNGQRQAQFWTSKMIEFMATKLHLDPASYANADGNVSRGIFANAAGGAITSWQGQIYSRNGVFAGYTSQLQPGGEIGNRTEETKRYVEEFLAGTTARAKQYQQKAREAAEHSKEDLDAYQLEWLVKAVIDWSNSPEFSEPVDVLVLSAKEGAKWIVRKETCRITKSPPDGYRSFITSPVGAAYQVPAQPQAKPNP